MCRRWACRRHSTSALPVKKGSRCAATLAAQLGQNLPAGHFLGGWIRGHLALGSAFGLGRALAARRLGPQRWSPRDIASGALTHRPALRAAHPLFRPARFYLALNCRARAKTPYFTRPGASCLPLLHLGRIGLAHRGLGEVEACGRPREAPQALLHHRGCGGRLSGVSKGPHGSLLAKPRWRFPCACACKSPSRFCDHQGRSHSLLLAARA